MSYQEMSLQRLESRKGYRRPLAPPTPKSVVSAFIAERKMTRSAFANEIGVSVGAVAQWLSEKRKVPGPVLAYIKLYNAALLSKRLADVAYNSNNPDKYGTSPQAQ